MCNTKVQKLNIVILALASIFIVSYGVKLPVVERYRGWMVFNVLFKPDDNSTALREYQKPQYAKDIVVWKIDYFRGEAEVAVSPKAYNEVRAEFESGDLDNFNIVHVDMAELIKENLGMATP